jgi:hypothetical protein
MTLIDGAAKKLEAHVWEREVNEHYVEPHWCSERLFVEEKFDGPIWDPCCGFGRIPVAAIKAGFTSVGTDIKNRGYADFGGIHDFLTMKHHPIKGDVVCNPPFNVAPQFAARALSLEGVGKVAMVFPTARLNAAHWLRGTPLIRVWLMTPRPSMPPGHTITAGEKPGGGKMDFCWLVWSQGFQGDASIKWLRRDANSPADREGK